MIVFLSHVSVYAAFLQHAQSQWLRRNWLTLKAANESDSNAKYVRDKTLDDYFPGDNRSWLRGITDTCRPIFGRTDR